LAKELKVDASVSLEFLIEQVQKNRVKEVEIDLEATLQPLQKGVETALSAWDKMRQKEGHHLSSDIEARLKLIHSTLSKIEKHAPNVVKAYEEKLKKRLMESGFFEDGDFERICKEVLIYSDRVDIAEEMTRLKSHIVQFLDVIKSDAVAIGKKLDFLVQEMNREANSLGVKCQDLEIIQWTVLIKSELEKIREQVQNIE
jgi:uncharacterized protein (TIGR00255 family)